MLRVIHQGLGRKRLDAMTVVECDRFLEAAAGGSYGAPIGRPALTRIRSTLINAVRNDVRRGLVARNVAELSVMPGDQPGGRGRRALTSDELRSILSLATGATTILVDLSGRHGLRPAEARAVEWSGVDLGAGTLTVNAQMNRRHVRVAPKTKKAGRTGRIDGETIDGLIRWADRQSADRAAQDQPGVRRISWRPPGRAGRSGTGTFIDRLLVCALRPASTRQSPSTSCATPPSLPVFRGRPCCLADSRLGRHFGAHDHRGLPSSAPCRLTARAGDLRSHTG
jgi:hypothetical protein